MVLVPSRLPGRAASRRRPTGLTGVLAAAATELRSRRSLRAAGWLRVGLGVSGLVAPSVLPRSLGVAAEPAAAQAYAVRMASGRDLALGIGLLEAVRRGGRVRPWLLACLVADLTDAGAFAAAARRRQVARGRGLLTAVAALVGVASDVGGLQGVREREEHVEPA